MAAFPYHPLPFLLDSMSPTTPSSFIPESSCVVSQSDDEPSVGKKQTTGGGHSKAVDKLQNGEQVTQKGCLLRYRKRRTRNATALNSAKSKDAKGVKNKCNNGMKTENKSPQDPPTGFIHVRARRGQATDSHSLAERVRRKKISERMKILQCLVPGCEKVTGKALMLDEIISYVQSLQNQVEFLSMKLASVTVSPMFYDFGMDLEALLMVKPERVNSEASTTAAVLPCLQQNNPTQASAFVDSTTATFAPSLLLHQGQTHIVFSPPQDNGSVLWDAEEQRQKFLNSTGFNDKLCSFH